MFAEALSFDDVLITPRWSSLSSRQEVNLFGHIGGVSLQLPILSANMATVTETEMAIAVRDKGGLGVIHRMQPIIDQAVMVAAVKRYAPLRKVAFSFGLKDWKERTWHNLNCGVDVAVLDVAHGAQDQVLTIVKDWLELYDTVPLVIGNFATSDPIYKILDAVPQEHHGRLSFKVGIGGGSMCTTRVETGCGIPTFESIRYAAQAKEEAPIKIIADGGIRSSGDIVKALAAGADAVMLGYLFAGTAEAPGEVFKINGERFKPYRGSASYLDKKQRGEETRHVEGDEGVVPYRGSVRDIIDRLEHGIRSGFAYVGARTIQELQQNAQFVRITQSGYRESIAHGAS